jgi:hypothetical protein
MELIWKIVVEKCGVNHFWCKQLIKARWSMECWETRNQLTCILDICFKSDLLLTIHWHYWIWNFFRASSSNWFTRSILADYKFEKLHFQYLDHCNFNKSFHWKFQHIVITRSPSLELEDDSKTLCPKPRTKVPQLAVNPRMITAADSSNPSPRSWFGACTLPLSKMSWKRMYKMRILSTPTLRQGGFVRRRCTLSPWGTGSLLSMEPPTSERRTGFEAPTLSLQGLHDGKRMWKMPTNPFEWVGWRGKGSEDGTGCKFPEGLLAERASERGAVC